MSESRATKSVDQRTPLLLLTHSPPSPAGCAHPPAGRFELLRPEVEGATNGHARYDGSVVHRLNEVGCDVHAFDLQGHGLSEKYKQRPAYAEDLDDLARDVVQFISIVKEEYRKEVSYSLSRLC